MTSEAMARRRITTAHFMTHWGAPSSIEKQEPISGVDWAVLVFAPGAGRPSWRYASNGMSEMEQAEGVRTELYFSAKDPCHWAGGLLAAIAAYPRTYDTYLAEGDTIPLSPGATPVMGGTAAGILLASPRPSDPDTLGAIGGLFAEAVLVHRLVGLTPREMSRVEVAGASDLMPLISGAKTDLLIDRVRSDFDVDR